MQGNNFVLTRFWTSCGIAVFGEFFCDNAVFVNFFGGFAVFRTPNVPLHLALNEDVREKLREEIKLAVKSNPDSTLYDLAHNIEYLDCVISETLRLNPPVAQLNRECVEDFEFNGIHMPLNHYIPAGLEVIIPVYFLHRDPNTWPTRRSSISRDSEVRPKTLAISTSSCLSVRDQGPASE